MSNDKIKQLLQDLHQELKHARLDKETLQMTAELDKDIHRLLEEHEEEAGLKDQVTEQARSIDARFAAEHPVAERLLREIVDVLGRMGI